MFWDIYSGIIIWATLNMMVSCYYDYRYMASWRGGPGLVGPKWQAVVFVPLYVRRCHQLVRK